MGTETFPFAVGPAIPHICLATCLVYRLKIGEKLMPATPPGLSSCPVFLPQCLVTGEEKGTDQEPPPVPQMLKGASPLLSMSLDKCLIDTCLVFTSQKML